MSTKLTQSTVNGLRERHPPGFQVYDAAVPGLRIVVGGRSASYKLVGRINDGSERYVSIIVGRTDELPLKEARDKARELRLLMRRGVDPRVAKRTVPTLREAWERYEKTRCRDLRPLTVEWYRTKVHGFLKPLLDLPMDKLDRETVRRLHEKITLGGHPIAANGAMRALKALYNDACRGFNLPPNPVSRGVRLNKERKRNWAVSPDDLPAMWRALDAMTDRLEAACWLTMLTTGLRKNDARTMEWANLDADGVLLVPSPKGGPDRSFKTPLPRLLLQELERVRQETAHLQSPFVFATPITLCGHIMDLRRTEEFPFAPHQMRHTYRTVALEAGVPFESIVVLMNHRPPGVSWNYVTRAHLVGHMRIQQERIVESLLSHRGRRMPAHPGANRGISSRRVETQSSHISARARSIEESLDADEEREPARGPRRRPRQAAQGGRGTTRRTRTASHRAHERREEPGQAVPDCPRGRAVRRRLAVDARSVAVQRARGAPISKIRQARLVLAGGPRQVP